MKSYIVTIIAAAALYLPVSAQEIKSEAASDNVSRFKYSASVDMQVEKQLYDEFISSSTNRIQTITVNDYRQAFDEFWLRVVLKGKYQLEYLESSFNIAFYPYWTMRKKVKVATPNQDLLDYLDVFQINEAYFKLFKEYTPENDLTFKPYIKIGRDGMQNSCSQLFGNYLDQPSGGYGASRFTNIAGPFKNRKVSANQLEAGLTFNVFNIVGGATSVMLGGNLNNGSFYGTTATQFWQIEDSKLSAGFFRAYQDLYAMDKKIHVGVGVRNYVSIMDSASTNGVLKKENYFSVQWVFDAAIYNEVKFYTEMAMQKMSSDASTGIVRPINIGITLPTFGVLDMFALELENVSPTHFWHNPFYSLFSDKPLFNPNSMRDAVSGRNPTQAFAWGMVLEKSYLDRITIAWGLYSGNPTGDMKTTLRISSAF